MSGSSVCTLKRAANGELDPTQVEPSVGQFWSLVSTTEMLPFFCAVALPLKTVLLKSVLRLIASVLNTLLLTGPASVGSARKQKLGEAAVPQGLSSFNGVLRLTDQPPGEFVRARNPAKASMPNGVNAFSNS